MVNFRKNIHQQDASLAGHLKNQTKE